MVQVIHQMRSNSKNPVELPTLLKGKVHKIDKDGDALIAFDGHDKKHWVKKTHFCNLMKIDQKMEIGAVSEMAAISEGAFVCVMEMMHSSSKNAVELSVGLKGKVHKIDKDGDALIAFDGHDTKHWVKQAKLNKLSLVEDAKVVKGQTKSTTSGFSTAGAAEKPVKAQVEKREYTSAAAQKKFVCSKCLADKVACDRCWGSGKSCWNCSGQGFFETGNGEECILCEGAGHFKENGHRICMQCGGSGKASEMCRKCVGSGGEECRRCRGRGRPFCKDCHAIFKQATSCSGLGPEPTPGVTIKRCDPSGIEALKKLWGERGGNGSVLAAWSIDNPLLSWRLRTRQQDYRNNNSKDADEVQGFHGTPAQNILSISTNGLDAGRRAGQVYGAGEYFAKCPEVSRGYCRGDSYMLVCRLLLGKQASSQQLGDGDHIWVPSMKYYVIASPEQVLPLYIVKFAEKQGPSDLENILCRSVWSTVEHTSMESIPANRPCAMTSASTDFLWMGYLHHHHSDKQLEEDVASFLKNHLPAEHVDKWQICIVRGKYTQAKVRLQVPLAREIVGKLNEVSFVEAGTRRTITVDDAHGSPGQKCPRAVAQFCRGRNLRYLDPCWCDHTVSPTASATYSLTPIDLCSARGDEIVSKFMASTPFHNGQPKIVGIKAINNATLSNLYDRFRRYLADKNKEEPKVIELYHGTNNNILDVLYTHGLQPPSDMAPAEDCPVSGGKGLCTSICNNDCNKCTTKHQWNRCHMYGLGIYVADISQKSHRYVSQPAGSGHSGKQRYRMVLCSVLMGRTLMIEGHLCKGDAMHDVSSLRRIWKGDFETMVQPCGGPLFPKGSLPAEEHDLIFVKGLGVKSKPGFSVHNSEYIAFHPYQCLPRYEIEYELC